MIIPPRLRPQQHFNGCIPACAVGALSVLGIEADECDLLRAMSAGPHSSGFDDLRHALGSLHPGVRLIEVNGAPLPEIVRATVRAGLPALVPHQSDTGAHCVLALDVDAHGAQIAIADPWPGHGLATIVLAQLPGCASRPS